jgi:hypothetical protein
MSVKENRTHIKHIQNLVSASQKVSDDHPRRNMVGRITQTKES